MIVDCAIYRDGRREPVDGDISDALDATRRRGGGFLWIGLHEPTGEEFALVKDELALHPLAVEDAVNAHQRPKLELYGDVAFVVLKTLGYAAGISGLQVGEIMVFVSGDFVITVRHGQANPLTAVRTRLEADPQLLTAGPSAVLYGVCDEVVDAYQTIAHELEASVISTERRVFSSAGRNLAEEIYSLKREVLTFRAAEDPLTLVLHDIVKGRVDLHPTTRDYFSDVLDHLLRLDSIVDANNELLTNILSAHLAQVSTRQNEDMRKISAWAAIIAVPTAIAGIYGMNFDHMPELHWTIGYPLVLAVMAVTCLIVYRRLRDSGWL
jgi:magnesium/cobalt transport protein CorA